MSTHLASIRILFGIISLITGHLTNLFIKTDLWVWNAPRGGFSGSPKNEKVVARNRAAGKVPDDSQKKAVFQNDGGDENMKNAELFFQDTFWGKLGHGDPVLNVNTYEGHQWNVKVDKKTVRTFVIDKRPMQKYTI